MRTNSKSFHVENKARESPSGRGHAQPILRNEHLVGVGIVAFGFSKQRDFAIQCHLDCLSSRTVAVGGRQ